MMFVLPLIMLMFIINTASLFAFYIFTSTLISTVTTPLITKIVNKLEKKQEEKREQEIYVDYRRK
jgi:membrane protein insertase Oxa1/YidC/SpoIIIJ